MDIENNGPARPSDADQITQWVESKLAALHPNFRRLVEAKTWDFVEGSFHDAGCRGHESLAAYTAAEQWDSPEAYLLANCSLTQPC